MEAIDVDSRASVFVPLKVTLSPSSQVQIHSLPSCWGAHMPMRLPCTVICEVVYHTCLSSCVSSLAVRHIVAVELLSVMPEINRSFSTYTLCLLQKAVNTSGAAAIMDASQGL